MCKYLIYVNIDLIKFIYKNKNNIIYDYNKDI